MKTVYFGHIIWRSNIWNLKMIEKLWMICVCVFQFNQIWSKPHSLLIYLYFFTRKELYIVYTQMPTADSFKPVRVLIHWKAASVSFLCISLILTFYEDQWKQLYCTYLTVYFLGEQGSFLWYESNQNLSDKMWYFLYSARYTDSTAQPIRVRQLATQWPIRKRLRRQPIRKQILWLPIRTQFLRQPIGARVLPQPIREE